MEPVLKESKIRKWDKKKRQEGRSAGGLWYRNRGQIGLSRQLHLSQVTSATARGPDPMQRLPYVARSAAAVRSGRIASISRGWRAPRASTAARAWALPASQRFLSAGASQVKEKTVNLIIEPAAKQDDPSQVTALSDAIKHADAFRSGTRAWHLAPFRPPLWPPSPHKTGLVLDAEAGLAVVLWAMAAVERHDAATDCELPEQAHRGAAGREAGDRDRNAEQMAPHEAPVANARRGHAQEHPHDWTNGCG